MSSKVPKKKASSPLAESETAPAVPIKDKPLPLKRPGTSGTELNLRARKERAHTAFQKAQRAEQAHRARRRASYARQDARDAKAHFGLAGRSLRAGVVCTWHVVRAVPSVMSERRERVRERKEEKNREKEDKKKVKWEAKERARREKEEAVAAVGDDVSVA